MPPKNLKISLSIDDNATGAAHQMTNKDTEILHLKQQLKAAKMKTSNKANVSKNTLRGARDSAKKKV